MSEGERPLPGLFGWAPVVAERRDERGPQGDERQVVVAMQPGEERTLREVMRAAALSQGRTKVALRGLMATLHAELVPRGGERQPGYRLTRRGEVARRKAMAGAKR